MPTPQDDPSTVKTVDVKVDGQLIHTSIRGSGRPLLLIMGIGGNMGMWRPFEEAITPLGVQTIAFDMPGTAGSTPRFPPPRMRNLARLTTGLLDALGYGTVDVLGVSWGGAVAQTLARRHPARVRRLILAATAPGLGGLPPKLSALLPLATPLRYWSPGYFRTVAPRIYGGRARLGIDRDAPSDAGRFENPPSMYGYLAQVFAISGWSSLPWLHRLAQPTLVLAGDDDPLVPLANGRLIAWRIPNSELRVIEGGGHLFLVEQAAETAAHISTFLAAEQASRSQER